jgi:hypothetical protein
MSMAVIEFTPEQVRQFQDRLAMERMRPADHVLDR